MSVLPASLIADNDGTSSVAWLRELHHRGDCGLAKGADEHSWLLSWLYDLLPALDQLRDRLTKVHLW